MVSNMADDSKQIYDGNLGLLYNKDYFRDEDGKSIFELETEEKKTHIETTNEALETYKVEKDDQKNFEPEHYFTLKVMNPGLVIGIGYSHDIQGSDIGGEPYKMGLFFDYTTGLPMIPGSSIKGVLRSAFPSQYKESEEKKCRITYIKSILREILGDERLKKLEINEAFIENLENEIFEGISLQSVKRDVFFDATITESANNLLGRDYITPHDPNGFENPIPIKFLKIMPETVFKFAFRLSKEKDSLLHYDEKLLLFMKIIMDLGVGAKTNVGYGHFDKPMFIIEKNRIIDEEKKRIEDEEKIKISSMSAIEKDIYLLKKIISGSESDEIKKEKVCKEYQKLYGKAESEISKCEDKMKIVYMIKEYWKDNLMWEKKQTKKPKQTIRVEQIKNTLKKHEEWKKTSKK